jgi:hypothetical protein
MARVDLGKTVGELQAVETKKNTKSYPSMSIYDIDVGLTQNDAGKKFTALITGKIRRVSSTARADGTKDNSVELDVHTIDFGGKGKSTQKEAFDSFYYGKKRS